jgi:hypothetical protein
MDDHAFDGRERMEEIPMLEVDYRAEHDRMLTMLEYIHKISGEMLEPVRRAGPGVKTHFPKNGASKTNVHQVMRELRLKDD